MANEQNLKPFVKGEQRQKELGRKGGKASVISRSIAKTFKETIDNELSDEDLKKIIKKIINEAQKGNMKAVELLRDTRGEKPVERQEVKEVTSEWFK